MTTQIDLRYMGPQQKQPLMNTFHSSHHIIFAGDNTFLRIGLEVMLERPIFSEHDCDIHFQEKGGLLLFSPSGCDRRRQMALFSLVQRLRNAPDWRGVVLRDARDIRASSFARLSGLPSVDLRQPSANLCREIMTMDHTATRRVAYGVKSLTLIQWETILHSLDDEFRREKRNKAFYVHRHVALSRIGIRNIHELRVMMSN
ncbi:hypothetical protein C3433_24055 [Citrobacter freundii]|nr:hypothetical protein [Salmonella enterica]EHW9198955.1 hypothetical protein [Salmonella enterica]EKA1641126.1 hypothetical protein [Salmonella enterica]POT24518.1 hypothetical protein C3433_24055 [Citrobacter freundii]